jgi:Immunity protein 72
MNKYDRKITAVADEPLLITLQDRAQSFWLVRRYTSLAYIRRMSAINANFVGGYEQFARGRNYYADYYRENLVVLYKYRALLAEGLRLLERGHAVGHATVLMGCGFSDYLTGRRFEGGRDFEEIGYRVHGPPQGLYAWAAIAVNMAARIKTTLEAKWAFPLVLLPEFVTAPFPATLAPEPTAMTRIVRTGDDVPSNGIWCPVDVASGCANYFWAGRQAPLAERANNRLDYPAIPGPRGLKPPSTLYTYAQEPARWQLLWEDHRYDRTPVPEEPEFLAADTEPPPWPPVHSTVPARDE